MAYTIPSGKAYPVQPGDLVVTCWVCGKQVPMMPRQGDVWEVLFHNGPDGTSCNGTGRMARLQQVAGIGRE